MSNTQSVELRIDTDVYRAAMTRANQVGMSLAAIGKAVLYAEADRTAFTTGVPESRPPLREYGVDRTPLRFKLPKQPYDAASAKIHASGRSVAAAVEDGLREYAMSGVLPVPSAPPLTAPARKQYTGTAKAKVLAVLGDHADGLTDREIQDVLGMSQNTERPRRGELVKAGLVAEDGTRTHDGSEWAVWKITTEGREQLAATKENA